MDYSYFSVFLFSSFLIFFSFFYFPLYIIEGAIITIIHLTINQRAFRSPIATYLLFHLFTLSYYSALS